MPADAIATRPGEKLARINVRAGDDRVYQIDCQPLLRQHELLSGITDCDALGLSVSAARSRQGRYLEARIAAGSLPPGATHVDHILRATVRTSQGSVGVAVEVRVFA